MIYICFLFCIIVFAPYVYIDFQRKILCETKFENAASELHNFFYNSQILFSNSISNKETLDEDRRVKKV